jgi:hypothetical protein
MTPKSMPLQAAKRWRPLAAIILRWTGRGVLLVGALLGLLAMPMALTTRIIPPVAPHDPVTVIVVDHGDTPSLVLPGEQSGMVRYAYGDWQWYALGNTGYLRAIPTLLLPTQGALGRQEMPGNIIPESVEQQMRVGFERMHTIQVQRQQVQRLRGELDQLFEQQRRSRVFSPASDLHFVHHRSRYSYFHNSNHMLAAWLEQLGCTLRGPAYTSRWSVEPPS